MHALLLAFADPAQLSPGELDRVLRYVERFARHAELYAADAASPHEGAAAACFLIQPQRQQPGRFLMRAAAATFEPGDLILDCTHILYKLRIQIAGLDKRLPPQQLGLPDIAMHPGYVGTLRTIKRRWGAPPARRFHRSRFHPRVEIVAGLESLWVMLAGAAVLRDTDEAFQRLLLAQERRSEWSILNEGPGGMSLRYVSGNAARVQVGELVGVRPREHHVPIVCLARRAVGTDDGGLDIGVAELAPQAIPMTATFGRDGNQEETKVVFLPRLPAHANTPGLILPPGRVVCESEIRLHEGRWTAVFRVMEHLESTASFDFVALAPVTALSRLIDSARQQLERTPLRSQLTSAPAPQSGLPSAKPLTT